MLDLSKPISRAELEAELHRRNMYHIALYNNGVSKGWYYRRLGVDSFVPVGKRWQYVAARLFQEDEKPT